MSRVWEPIRLGEVLTPVSRTERVDQTKDYPLLGVRLEGGGAFHRETKLGSQISAKSLRQVNNGDFIYSRLFAWRGAFGVIGRDLHGGYVSNEFPTFRPVNGKIDVEFLRLWFRLPAVIRKVEADCSGSTPQTRNRFKEPFFLAMKIPLPPLPEQRRMVAHIEELVTRIEEARGLRRQAVEEAESLVAASRASVFEEALGAETTRLDNVAYLNRGKFSHRPRNDPRFFGGSHPWIQIPEIEASNKYIRDYKQTLNDAGLAISRKFPKGTLLISIAATIGAVGILDFDCCVPDSVVAATPKSSIDGEYLYHYLGYLRSHLEQVAPQSAQKNINLKILSVLPIPDLPIFEQRRIVTYLNGLQAKMSSLKLMQAETTAELDALLPSVLDKAFKAQLR